MAEAFTSGRVSAMARKSYVEGHPALTGAFEHCPRGYTMYAWESQIAMARACGRGTASGRGRPTHPYDKKQS